MEKVAQLDAVSLAEKIRCGDVSSREAVQASLDTIGELDDSLQAFITIDRAGALAEADACDKRRGKKGDLPILFGVPVAVKDVTVTKGLKTTFGSAIYADNVPEKDAHSVAQLRKAGTIIVGKTNTPEFAFGAVCTNKLRGPTRNPWNNNLTSGGSSGGSAVAVTTGMVPLAQGTDFGGSVRTPASFCGCVGLRPTPGLIAEPDRPLAWDRLATQGVLARTVNDAALMLDAIRGPHKLDPTSSGHKISSEIHSGSLRVTASATLDDSYILEPRVRKLFASATMNAEKTFGTISETQPDCEGSSQAFKTLRAASSWLKFGKMVEDHTSELTESFVWNVRQGRAITAEKMLQAEVIKTRVWRNFMNFFEEFDILMLPAASVLPFPISQGEVTSIDGHECETIIDYLACTYIISLIGFPSLALPALWTDDGIPFGVQLVAKPNNEEKLIQAGRMLESTGFRHRWPIQSPEVASGR